MEAAAMMRLMKQQLLIPEQWKLLKAPYALIEGNNMLLLLLANLCLFMEVSNQDKLKMTCLCITSSWISGWECLITPVCLRFHLIKWSKVKIVKKFIYLEGSIQNQSQ